MANIVYDDQQEKKAADARYAPVSDAQLADMERAYAAPARGEAATKSSGGKNESKSKNQSGKNKNQGDGKYSDGPANTTTGSDKLANSRQLAAKEGEADWNYSPSKPKKRRVHGWMTKKRVGIAGGILGIGLGGSVLVGLPAVGLLPLEVASHALKNAFSHSNNETSSRLSGLFRFARAVKANDIGETRVTILGSKVFATTTAQLRDIGVEFNRQQINGRPTGVTIDQKKLSKTIPELNGVELGSDEAKSIIAGRINVSQDVMKAVGTDGTFTADLQGFTQRSLSLLTKSSVKLLGDSWVTTSIKTRPLKKFFDVHSLFHPFSKTRSAAEQKFVDTIQAAKEKKGESPSQALQEAQAEAPAQENSVAFNDSVQKPFQADAKTVSDSIESSKNGFGSALVKGLTFTGAACIIRNTAGDIAKANRDIVALPAAAAAMRVIAAGDQVKTGGGGITASQTGAMIKSFNDQNGASIFGGKAFNSLASPGSSPSGTDLPGQYQQAFNGKSTAANVQAGADAVISTAGGGIISPAVLCSPAGLLTQAALAVAVSVGAEALSGGLGTPAVASLWAGKFIGSNVISMVVAGAVIGIIEHTAINNHQLLQEEFSGPVGGDLLAAGARTADGISSIANGGISLGNDSSTVPDTTGSLATLDGSTGSQSMFARIFSLNNYDSMASRLAMTYYSSGMSRGLSGIAGSFLNVGGALQSTLMSLLPRASAATTNTYDWGFPQYGIPDEMLNDPSLADPYANADAVAKTLDGSGGQSYIDKAAACFGVSVKKGADGLWDVVPDHMIDTSSLAYTQAGCTDIGPASSIGGVDQTKWRQVIMFIFDTNTMKAAACAAGQDSQSCSDEGINITAFLPPTPDKVRNLNIRTVA